MATKQSAKQSPSGKNPKNTIVAVIAVVAMVGAAAGLYLYLRPTPPPPPDVNVMTNATPEEIKAHEAQKEGLIKLEKKMKPAGA